LVASFPTHKKSPDPKALEKTKENVKAIKKSDKRDGSFCPIFCEGREE
jgi:hypothetical protein